MLLSRRRQDQPTTTLVQSSPAAPTDREVAAAIEVLVRGGDTGTALGPEARRAIADLVLRHAEREGRSAAGLAGFSGEVSATGTNICWITYDVQQVADNSTAINGAVAEFVESIGQISETSQTSANDASRVRDGVQQSIVEMRDTGLAMRQISEQVSSIAQRCGELEKPSARFPTWPARSRPSPARRTFLPSTLPSRRRVPVRRVAASPSSPTR